jgi:small subunit ribosomal protein S8e
MKRGRKISGGKYHKQRKKKSYEKQTQENPVLLGERKTKKIRTHAGKQKTILLKTNQVNIKLKDGKTKKAEIKNVLETPQNKFLARQNRLLKSAVIETSLGKAKITNRPSQEGQVNAVLIDEE